jgi:CBS domain-containing protein
MLNERIGRLLERDRPVTTVPEASVFEVARLMHRHGIGAVMVLESGRLAGIFTERDALFRVMAPGLDPCTVRVADVMTVDPKTVDPDATFGQAMLLMHEHGFRHLPVVENGVPIGMVSARDALDPELEDFICEVSRREALR